MTKTCLDLDTPVLVIDVRTMRQNALGIARIAKSQGIALGPRIKMHESPCIARQRRGAGASPITVAKISEAEVMVEGGGDDIFVAYPLSMRRSPRNVCSGSC